MFTLCLLKVGPINQNFYNSRPDFVDGLKLVKLKVLDNTIASRSASKSSIRKFVITDKAPTRAFSWLKAVTTAFTFKTLLRHYAKWTLAYKL